jgi:hypothetical protein
MLHLGYIAIGIFVVWRIAFAVIRSRRREGN